MWPRAKRDSRLRVARVSHVDMARSDVPSVGEEAPDFTLLDSLSVERTFSRLVADRRRVVLCYRGHW
jgi:hypothetical protein